MRRKDEVAAQSRSERDRWTFYETIKFWSLGFSFEEKKDTNLGKYPCWKSNPIASISNVNP
jgi:hypothetical protein